MTMVYSCQNPRLEAGNYKERTHVYHTNMLIKCKNILNNAQSKYTSSVWKYWSFEHADCCCPSYNYNVGLKGHSSDNTSET